MEIYTYKHRDGEACIYKKEDSWYIKKGSIFAKEHMPNFIGKHGEHGSSKNLLPLRNKILTLYCDNNVLQEDYEISSAALAGALVSYDAAGVKSRWKDKNGVSLSTIEPRKSNKHIKNDFVNKENGVINMIEEKELIEEDRDTRRVFTEKKDFPLSTIKEMFDDGDIIPQPDYQREYVMDEKQASKLVESVLMGIPIPTVYLCEEIDGTFSIIDGQQRMTSFVRFLKNEFSLKGLEELSELNKKFFLDLDKSMQRNIKAATLNSIILTKESSELKYEIFARLNQGSIKLKPQELRNCVYRGTFNNMLEDIAKNNKTLETLFIEGNKRKTYQENILRFFALRNFNSYSSSMGKTMNLYMVEHLNDDEKKIEEAKKLFNSKIDIIKQVFGNLAFCAYDRTKNQFMNKFSGSVYDSIIIACSMFDNHVLMNNADMIRRQVEELKKNNLEYQDYTYAATGSKDRVVGRILLIYNTISEIVGRENANGSHRNFDYIIKEQLFYAGYVCPYCNNEILKIEDAEVDHIIPYSRGGATTEENAQLLHRHCNRTKNNSVDFEDNE